MQKHMNYRDAVVFTRALACVVAVHSLSGCGSNANGDGNEVVEKNLSNLNATNVGPQSPTVVADHPAQTEDEWAETMSKTPPPKNGCFTVTRPNTSWSEIPCEPAPAPTAHRIPPRRKTAHTYTVGGGTDYIPLVVGTIASASGQFPSVVNTTSVASRDVKTGALIPGSYSLQLNTNFFNSPVCAGAKVPADCSGVQQYVFSYDGPSNTNRLLIEYWLTGWANACPEANPPPGCIPCPAGFGPSGNNCIADSQSPPNIPPQPITNLAYLTLYASAPILGSDVAMLRTQGGTLYSASSSSLLGLGSTRLWDFAEFNIFGNAGSTCADLNAGSSLVTEVAVQYNGTASPTCQTDGGPTAETNNLTYVPGSCCSFGGTTTKLRFSESNASPLPQAPFCLLNDITPIQFSLL